MKSFGTLAKVFAFAVLLLSTNVSASELELKFARYFYSDLSGSCEVCATFNGIVEVKNIEAEKQVIIHYTGNFMRDWTSTRARYLGPSRPGYEYWTFSTGIAGNAAEFAIEYQFDGKVFWDNNQQSNYRIRENNPLFGSENKVLLSRNEKPIIFRFPNMISYLGAVHLRNLGYEKSVSIRYTTDSWRTWQEVSASYSETEENGLELWRFGVDFPSDAQEVQLAVAYTVNGDTYWDNNLGRNYRFDLPQ